MRCTTCGKANLPDNARFCPECGQPLATGSRAGANVTINQQVEKVEHAGKVSGLTVEKVFGDVIVVSSLSELDAVDRPTKEKLRRAYEAQIRHTPEAARYHLALGLSYLDLGLYSEAITSLGRALERAPHDANTLYYLALAYIGGRELRTLAPSDVRVIESYLDAAIRLDATRAHYLYLWTLVKYEYYLHNGFEVAIQQIEEALSYAQRTTYLRSEIAHLFKHAPVPESPLTEAILAWW